MSELTFILLPGMIGTADLFAPLMEVIPPTIRTGMITYPTDAFLDYSLVQKLIEQQIGDEEKLVVIGESYSGALALMVAGTYPERVVAVVMSGGYVSPPWPRFLRFLIRPVLLKIRIPSFIIRLFAAGENASEEFVAKIRNALAVPTPEVMVRRAREALTMENRLSLVRCKSPILYLAPDKDRLVPGRNLREILKVRPDVKVCSIAGPHLILQTAPEKSWKAIESFVAEILST